MLNLAQPKTSSKINKDQLSRVLYDFYQKPIAQVSTELFFTIGAIIFFAIFAIRPTIITMTDLIKEIEDKKKTSEALTKKVTALSTVQTEYYTLQDQFPLLDDIIPSVPNPDRLLQIIEKIASENQISITSMQMKEVPFPEENDLSFSQKQPTTTALTISITGEYAAIKTFIKTINNSKPLITVDSISFVNSTKNNTTLGLVATIHAEAHYYTASADNKESSNQSESTDEISL